MSSPNGEHGTCISDQITEDTKIHLTQACTVTKMELFKGITVHKLTNGEEFMGNKA